MSTDMSVDNNTHNDEVYVTRRNYNDYTTGFDKNFLLKTFQKFFMFCFSRSQMYYRRMNIQS